ncbi:hypothetical protein H0H81_004694 [Sphagnurus paluster]|uniref:HAT C-terminal dimerisation domain-containing protein n=1 Tax=Sphagnurus paluster TaxID=117069 RepID=A0A9P7GGR6_9AGAR|nr:hypothetical protein H0H81_004694 [Sphagnurus paluster]
MARLNAIERELSLESIRSSAATPTSSSQPAVVPEAGSQTTLSPEQIEAAQKAQEAAWLEEDIRIINEEWNCYIADGLIEGAELDDLDLLRFWTNMKPKYPLLFRVALDVLPVQASSVPCERVFSSSKETNTLRRSQLSPAMMEVLQMLKFMFRSDRMDFNDDWLVREDDMAAGDPKDIVDQQVLTSIVRATLRHKDILGHHYK